MTDTDPENNGSTLAFFVMLTTLPAIIVFVSIAAILTLLGLLTLPYTWPNLKLLKMLASVWVVPVALAVIFGLARAYHDWKVREGVFAR